MPNIWTHIIYGEKLAKETAFQLSSSKEKAYYYLGCQGPDPFYYHSFWPWIKEKPVTQLGNDFHTKDCGSILIDMIQFGGNHPEDRLLKAYIMGFVSHHLLDRNTHPYIIFRSGREDNKHQQLETIIDTILVERFHGLKTWKVPVYKEIYSDKKLHQPIIDMMDYIVKKYFPQRAEKMPNGYLNKSYLDTIKALRILFDPLGWKHKLLPKWAEPLSHKKVSSETDYLNLKEAAWSHPAFREEKSSESFLQLLETAETEGISIFNQINDYWKHPDNNHLTRLHDSLGNLSYETGKDCSIPNRDYYCEPIV